MTVPMMTIEITKRKLRKVNVNDQDQGDADKLQYHANPSPIL